MSAHRAGSQAHIGPQLEFVLHKGVHGPFAHDDQDQVNGFSTDLKAKTDKLATDTKTAAQPKDLNVPVVSTPITLKITPAPITLSVGQPATPVAGT